MIIYKISRLFTSKRQVINYIMHFASYDKVKIYHTFHTLWFIKNLPYNLWLFTSLQYILQFMIIYKFTINFTSWRLITSFHEFFTARFSRRHAVLDINSKVISWRVIKAMTQQVFSSLGFYIYKKL
jgi:hypothetical protein